MINLLLAIIIFTIACGLLYWLVGMLPIPEPFATVIKVCAILICIMLMLGTAFGDVALPALRLRRYAVKRTITTLSPRSAPTHLPSSYV